MKTSTSLLSLLRPHRTTWLIVIGFAFTMMGLSPKARADSRAIEFPNTTGKDVDDLHIETTYSSALAASQPFLNDLQADTRTHNLWGATVPNGGSAFVRLDTAPGDRATITRWWWTLGGNAISNGVAVGTTNGDNGGLKLSSSTNGLATGDGQLRISVGGWAYIFHTVPGDNAQDTLNRFSQFLDSAFQIGSTDLIESYPDPTGAIIFLGNVQGDPQRELVAEIIRQDSTQPFLLSPVITEPAGQSPTIVSPPQNQAVCSGNPATFSVAAQGTAPLSYQWEWNGTPIPGATSPVLMLPSPQPANAGSYRARVSNAYGATYSAAAVLTIQQPPVINTQPQSLTISGGTDALFNVAAGGSAPLTYQWRRQGVALVNNGRISGVTSPTLRVASAQASDNGSYDVIVANACGTRTSLTAVLTVQTNTTPVTNRTFIASSPITIRSDGPAMTYPSTISVSGVSGTVRKITVTISNLQHSFPGDLDILLTGPQGQKAMLLSDVGGPSSMDGVTLTLDGDATTVMPATGFILSGTYRPTNYDVDGMDVFPAPAPAGPYSTDLATFVGTNPNGTWRLLVVDDTADDAGEIGNGWSLRLTTTGGVSGTPPSITMQPQDRTVACQGEATMVVAATGSAPLGYQWRFGGADVAGATSPTFTLSQVTAEHVGTYGVVITNAYGAVTSAPAVISVTDTNPVLVATRDSANLNLSWPVSCEDYLLEQADRLTQPWPQELPALWRPGPEAVLEGDHYRVSVPLAESASFFRLVANGEPAGALFNGYGRLSDPYHQINAVLVDSNGVATGFQSTEIPADAFTSEPIPDENKTDGVTLPPESPISPVLAQWLQTLPGSEEVSLIVTFQEDLRMPWLPELTTPEEREQANNPLTSAIEDIRRIRHAAQEPRIAELRRHAVFTLGEQFWLANSIEITTRLDQVVALSQSPGVVYVQPVEGGEEPPDGNPLNDVDDGRRRIFSDAYFAAGLVNPWIGLLDTGVRSTHVLFNNPRQLDWLRDCVNGGPNCAQAGNPGYDTSDLHNHGTGSAAILSGNNNLGNSYRGATAILLDSWKVYPAGKGLNHMAVVRGLQRAVAAADKVIVCEVQAAEAKKGAIATAADNAYDAGAIVVAPVGDFGPGAFTVRSPAIAHKVLGVGAYQVDTLAQFAAQGRGPTWDGRFKPDLQAPTGTETASAIGDNALRVYGGTSGAAPYVGAAAMLMRNFLQRNGARDHGHVYSWMILSGQRPWPYNNTVGAGSIQMPVNGWMHWGKLNVRHRRTINIPINVPPLFRTFEAALWWPERVRQPHSDVDVHLVDPNGVVRASSISRGSIFERVTVAGPLMPGVWQIKVRGFRVPAKAQQVYWSAMIHF